MAFANYENTTEVLYAFGKKISEPKTFLDKLSYYLDTVCSLLDIDEHSPGMREVHGKQHLAKLRDIESHKEELSPDEFITLIVLCTTFSPDLLIGNVFIQNNELISQNEFVAVNSFERMAIGGETKSLGKIMQFQPRWIVSYWVRPMRFTGALDILPTDITEKAMKIGQLMPELVPSLAVYFGWPPLRQPESSCCSIL